MRGDSFERFKEEYDNKLRERSTSLMLDTSFLTKIRTEKLYGLSDNVDILYPIENQQIESIIFYTPKHTYQKVLSKDDYIEAVCEECRNNIFFFVRLFLPRVMKKLNVEEKDIKLNYGVVSLMYYYDKGIDCILCNPRQTMQTLILSFLYYHAYYVSGKKFRNIYLYSYNQIIKDRISLISECVPGEMKDEFIKMGECKSEYEFHHRPDCIFCDDFEFLDIKNIMEYNNGRPVHIYGCGVINRKLCDDDIQYLNKNTNTILDDFEMVDSHIFKKIVKQSPEENGIKCPVDRIFFDTYEFFTESRVKELKHILDNEEVFNAEILRKRPQNNKVDLLDKFELYCEYKSKKAFENMSNTFKVYSIMYKIFTIDDIKEMSNKDVDNYIYLIEKIMRNKNVVKTLFEED